MTHMDINVDVDIDQILGSPVWLLLPKTSWQSQNYLLEITGDWANKN